MYSMETIKINKPTFLYRLTNENGEALRNKEINDVFKKAVEAIISKLEKDGKNISFANVFTEGNVLKMEDFLKSHFPNESINMSNLIEGGFTMDDLDDAINKAADLSLQKNKPYFENIEKLNRELLEELESLKNKKTIPVQLFLEIKKNNPNLSDQEALSLAKKQVEDFGELS